MRRRTLKIYCPTIRKRVQISLEESAPGARTPNWQGAERKMVGCAHGEQCKTDKVACHWADPESDVDPFRGKRL